MIIVIMHSIAGKDSAVELQEIWPETAIAYLHRLSSHNELEAALVALAGGRVNGRKSRRAAAALSDVREPC